MISLYTDSRWNMRYYINIEALKEKVSYMEKKLDIIQNDIEKLQQIKDNLNCEGEAANKFYLNYDNYLLSLKKAKQNITNAILFLVSFYNKYGEEYNRIKQKYSAVLSTEDYNG